MILGFFLPDGDGGFEFFGAGDGLVIDFEDDVAVADVGGFAGGAGAGAGDQHALQGGQALLTEIGAGEVADAEAPGGDGFFLGDSAFENLSGDLDFDGVGFSGALHLKFEDGADGEIAHEFSHGGELFGEAGVDGDVVDGEEDVFGLDFGGGGGGIFFDAGDEDALVAGDVVKGFEILQRL